MKKYTLPYFGELDLSEGDDFFESAATIVDSNFTVSIDFEGESPTNESLDCVNRFLAKLPLHIDNVKSYINQEFNKKPNFVSDYIFFFKEAIKENGDFDAYIDKSNSNKSLEEQLLNQLYLLRITICPNGSAFATFDYTIDEEYTDDLLVVYLTDNGELDRMTIES